MDDPSKRDAGYEYSYIYMAVLPVRIYNPACFYPGSHLGSFELFLSGFPLFCISEWTDEWTIPQKGMKDYSTVQYRYDSTQYMYTPILYNRTVSIRVPFFGSFRIRRPTSSQTSRTFCTIRTPTQQSTTATLLLLLLLLHAHASTCASFSPLFHQKTRN
jgi:hypothetical protein